MIKSSCIQNFELIIDILEHLKPGVSNLKQPGMLAACYFQKKKLH